MSKDVLRYTKEKIHASETIRRHFLHWRSLQTPPLQERCDIEDCIYFTEPLEWNNRALKPILDHINGVNSDNRPENLRFLCPNCDSQQVTRGGGNKRRVIKSSGGFARVADDGKTHHTIPAEAGELKMSRSEVRLVDLDGNGNIISER